MKQITLFKLLFPFLLLNFTHASSLKEAVEHALAKNPEVLSIQKNSEAYRLYIDEEKAGYYPTVDLDLYLENKKELKNAKDTSATTTNKQGYNAQVNVEQMIYDGGLTSAKVDEAKYDYQKTKISNIFTIENIIYETVQSYLDTVKYKELLVLSENNIAIHNSYLEVAKESEDVSGETLDRIQVESKMFLATSKLFQQKNDNEVAQNSFYKLVGYEPKGYICRPQMSPELIPFELEEARVLTLKNSFTILEQIEEIKIQRAIISQEKSRFLPTLKFQFNEEYDDDLDAKDTKGRTTSAKLLMSYNLFNGFRDQFSSQRERIFLQESQKKLDDTMNLVEEDIKSSYSDYQNSREKITYLKLYVERNKEILTVYKEQFSGGTRTFIDILNSEAELFNAKTQLIEEEYSLLNSYYEILLILSKLSDTIVLQDNQVCEEIVVDLEPKPLEISKDDDSDLSELEGLLDDGNGSDELSLLEVDESPEEIQEQIVKDLVSDILNDVYKLKKTEVDEVVQPKKVIPKSKKIALEKKEDKAPKKETKKPLIKKQTKDINETKIIKRDENVSLSDESNQTSTAIKAVQKEVDIRTFKERFLDANENSYTLNLITFMTLEEAKTYIASNEILSDTFMFKFSPDLKLVKVINGIYKTYDDALEVLEKINKKTDANIFIIDSIKNQKELFEKFNIDYEIEDKSKATIKKSETLLENEVTDDSEVAEYEKIENSEDLEYAFFNARENDYTLSISTYNNLKDLNTFVRDNKLDNKAFAFRFKGNSKLIKLTYGIYSSLEEAKKDFASISMIENSNVIIQQISDVHKLFGEHKIIKDESIKKEAKTLTLDDIKEIKEEVLEEKLELVKKENEEENEEQIEDKEQEKVEVIEEDNTQSDKNTDVEADADKIEEETNLEDINFIDKKAVIEPVEEILEIKIDTNKTQEKQEPIENTNQTDIVAIEKISSEITQENQNEDDTKKRKQLKINIIKQMERIKFFENKSKEGASLPQEFITPNSKKYTIMLLNFRSMKDATTYATRYELDDNTIIFGFKDKYKLIYGAYNSYDEAKEVISTFELFVKRTKPYVRRVYGYQSLYNKYNPTSNINDVYKKLKNVKTQKNAQPILAKVEVLEDIKTDIKKEASEPTVKKVEVIEKTDDDIVEIKELPLENEPKTDAKVEIKTDPKIEKLNIVKTDKTNFKNLKFLELESNDEISLSNEFVSKESKKYTIMILDFSNQSEALFYAKRHGLNKNSVIFGYQNKYKLIYNAFDSFKAAQKAVKKLPSFVKKTNPYVRKINGYQKLYKKYKNNVDSKNINKNYFSTTNIKEKFFKQNSKKYTITLTTSPNYEEARWFRYKYKINNDTIVYKFGSRVKVIYGIFNTAKEAKRAIENFDEELKKLKPFVNRLSTHQKLYKKYNKRIED